MSARLAWPDDGLPATGERSATGPATWPTSACQRDLLLTAGLDPAASRALNLGLQLELQGRICTDGLKAAWAELMSRHASLHQAFVDPGIARRLRRTPSTLTVTDLTRDSEPRQRIRVEQARDACSNDPYDLQQGPLLRAELLLLADDRAVLLVGAHQSLCDADALQALARELGCRYGWRIGVPDDPPEPGPAAVVDHAAVAPDGDGERALAWWFERYATLPPTLQLPTDRPRPLQRSYAAGCVELTLDAQSMPALPALLAEDDAGEHARLLSSLAALLHRLTGARDLVVAIPASTATAGGHPPGSNTRLLPLRITVDPAASLATLHDDCRRLTHEALQHRDVTIGGLLQRLSLPREPERPPLASVALDVRRATPAEAIRFPGLEVQVDALPRGFDLFEMSLTALIDTDRLRLQCRFNRALFDDLTVAHWMHAYRSLLDAALGDPSTTAGAVALVTGDALAELRALQPPLPAPAQPGWIHRIVDAAAECHTARPAVQACDGSLNYRELVARSNRLAHALRRRGAGPGRRIGVCLPRGVDAVPTLLAVMKTGAAYVPLDPNYPPSRLAFMAEDAGLPLVVSNAALHARLELPASTAVLLVDRDAGSIAAEPAVFDGGFECASDPARTPAYVIYTSGSTGKPKGVEVPHASVALLLREMGRILSIRPEDRQLAVVSLSFDVSVQDLFLPLSAGAELVLASDDEIRDGAALQRRIEASRITRMEATPTTWGMLLQAGYVPPAGFCAQAAGEPLPAELVRQLVRDGAEFWNLYGPTEATVHASWWRVEPRAGGMSIGRPIPGWRLWILDENDRPCPLGVPGEICIAGPGVALGYLDRPKLNRERFVREPVGLADDDGGAPQRMYRTGDLGRWCADGLIEHLGRRDGQVKLRGHRIELGEIEQRLARLDGVAQAAVTVRDAGSPSARLVGYVVVHDGVRFDPQAARQALLGVLPAIMVPQQFAVVDAMPTSPNGKLDRGALPDVPMQVADAAIEAAGEPPATPLECLLHGIWCELLGHAGFGRHDSFFDLGGHSLMAVQVFHRASLKTGVNLPLATLYQAPTLASLARAFAEAGSRVPNRADDDAADAADGTPADRWRPLVEIRPCPDAMDCQPPLFLIHAVGGNVMNYRLLASRLPADIPVYGLQAVGLDGLTTPLPTVEAMAARYVDEILSVQPSGQVRLGGGSMGGVIAYEVARQLTARGHAVAPILMFDSEVPWPSRQRADAPGVADAARRPLARVRELLREGPAALPRIGRALSIRGRRVADRVQARLQRLRGRAIPHAVRYRLLEDINRRAYFDYRPGEFAGGIHLFVAFDDPARQLETDPTLGWSAFIGDRVQIEPVPGTHHTLIEQPALAEALAAALASHPAADPEDSR